MEYQIRTALPEDLDAVCRVENRCFPEAEAATRAAFQTRIKLFPERFLVAEHPTNGIIGLINGCCTDTPVLGDELYEPDCPHSLTNPWQTVFGLDTLPEYRRRGVAAALMNAFIAQAKARGQLGVALTCKAHLVHYYERFGYRNEGVSASVHGGAVWYDMVLRF